MSPLSKFRVNIGALRKVVFLALLTVTTGCALGAKFTAAPDPDDDQALIYVYRPWQFVSGAGSPTIKINNEFSVGLTNGGYTQVKLPAGAAFLRIEKPPTFLQVDWSGSAFFETSPGKTYFVRWTPIVADAGQLPTGGLYIRTEGNFRLVDERVGRREILKTNFVALEVLKE